MVSLASMLSRAIDIRDIFVLSGIALISYGFYLFSPALGFIIGGNLLFFIGLRMGKAGGK